jgi:hypothetical protein
VVYSTTSVEINIIMSASSRAAGRGYVPGPLLSRHYFIAGCVNRACIAQVFCITTSAYKSRIGGDTLSLDDPFVGSDKNQEFPPVYSTEAWSRTGREQDREGAGPGGIRTQYALCDSQQTDRKTDRHTMRFTDSNQPRAWPSDKRHLVRMISKTI